jgi:hypothetical protein
MLARLHTARRIGPWGTTARVVVGTAMLAGAIIIGIGALDAVLGFVVFPLAVAVFVAIRGRHATPVRLTGSEGHCINCALGVAAFVFVPVAALLFYGSSMLVAVARGYGGCEIFAISNWVWRRDDQIACPVFHPVDLAERRASTRDSAGDPNRGRRASTSRRLPPVARGRRTRARSDAKGRRRRGAAA